MQLLYAFFLLHGRLSRSAWLQRLLALGVTCAAFAMLAGALFGEPGKTLFAAFFAWGAVALSAQRLHDTGRSASHLFLLLIPVAGPLWLLLLMCRRGTGPMALPAYAQVDIAK